ncbi:MAG: lytic transglycosylase [Legionellales bacterium]|nr:lytic transglycosylase [Legionellales bacterium]
MKYKTITYLSLLILFILNGCSNIDKKTTIVPETANQPNSIEARNITESEQLNQIQESEKPIANEIPSQKTYDNLWMLIRDHLVFENNINRKKVKNKVAWFSRNQQYIDRVVGRAEPYLYHIITRLKEREMPLDLALLPIVESAYQPFALSPSRASGIWQFIPSTGKRYGLKQNWWYDGRRDIVASTDAALDYLESLHKRFNGNWFHALAAYNSGEGNVERAIRKNKKLGKKTDFWALKLPHETRSYVPSLLAIAEVLKNSDKYKINFGEIKNIPYFEVIDVKTQIDLATVSNLSGLTIDEVYLLNPGFNRWATDPSGPHRILIPVGKAQKFKEKLAALPKSERIAWKQHIIQKGESLGLIAERYKTSVSAIKQTNRLKGNMIREGKSLLIPSSKQPTKFYSLSIEARKFRGLKTSDGKRYTYIVKRGDNLWDIGRNYGISVGQLTKWNGIAKKSFLRPKQKLIIWINEEDSNNKNNNEVQASAFNESTTEYVVKKGDSLWLIARRLDIHVADLLEWNNIRKNKALQPGQKLRINIETEKEKGDLVQTNIQSDPITEYVVKKGDSLWLIARRFDIHVADLLEWNNIRKNKALQPGQILIVRKSITGV